MSTIVTGKQLLFDKLNAANPDLPYLLDETNVQLGTPVANADTGIVKNTAIVVTGIDGQIYSGSVTAYYDRVQLSDIVGAGPTGCDCFLHGGETQVSQVLPAFNAMFNTNVQLEDIIDASLAAPDPNTGQIPFTLQAATTSHAFLGSVALTYKPTDVSLPATMTKTLTGLTSANLKAQSSELALLSIVNASNPTLPRPLTLSNSTVGAPTALSGADTATYGGNTSVVITPLAGYGYTTDPVTLYYNRQTLAAVLGAGPLTFDGNTTTYATSGSLVPLLNSLYGSQLTVADIVDEALPAADSTTHFITYTLTANAASWGYTGTVVLSIDTRLDLGTAITVDSVGGLTSTDVTT